MPDIALEALAFPGLGLAFLALELIAFVAWVAEARGTEEETLDYGHEAGEPL